MIGLPTPGTRLEVSIEGRRIRRREVSATYVKTLHIRSPRLRREFEDEFAQMVRGADLGLTGAATAAEPVYTLFDRRAVEQELDP